MKIFLGTLASAMLITSSSVAAFGGIKKDKTTQFFKSQLESNNGYSQIVNELTQIFNSDKIDFFSEVNRSLEEQILDEIKYDSNLDILKIYKDDLKKLTNNYKLINLILSEEFINELNNAFIKGYFVLEANKVEYLPYKEQNNNISFNLENKNEYQLYSNAPRVEIYTKWYWFGTYKATFNYEATIVLCRYAKVFQDATRTAAAIASFIPKIGWIAAKILLVISL
ncbi:hypothetical protein [Spiroplasma floricola]|uniref:Uncharacterized protein n=1 Tax=Spiroplasma floricola 23-6 TaxID=1336749 RepID=A0A2K8SED5_9MOLU|nr:hypothetical protein [Spiroplasma floricola]AUB31811.1 hypothetical protein SFLOR_v1c07630 [Spiroplasma floricola 23-6]